MGNVRDVLGDSVRIKNEQIIRFRDTAARTRSVMEVGWQPERQARQAPCKRHEFWVSVQ